MYFFQSMILVPKQHLGRPGVAGRAFIASDRAYGLGPSGFNP